MTDDDIAQLRNARLNDAAIHDAAVGDFNFVNRIASGLGVDLEEEYLSPRRIGAIFGTKRHRS